MAAPTEAEIRRAIDGSPLLCEDGTAAIDEPEGLWESLRPILDSDAAIVPTRRSPEGWTDEYMPGADHAGTLWADMRPSEYDELSGAIHEVRATAFAQYLAELREAVVGVALRFAEAHPDVPRGRWPIEHVPAPEPGRADPGTVAFRTMVREVADEVRGEREAARQTA